MAAEGAPGRLPDGPPGVPPACDPADAAEADPDDDPAPPVLVLPGAPERLLSATAFEPADDPGCPPDVVAKVVAGEVVGPDIAPLEGEAPADD